MKRREHEYTIFFKGVTTIIANSEEEALTDFQAVTEDLDNVEVTSVEDDLKN
jgi:hypothetical protein